MLQKQLDTFRKGSKRVTHKHPKGEDYELYSGNGGQGLHVVV